MSGNVKQRPKLQEDVDKEEQLDPAQDDSQISINQILSSQNNNSNADNDNYNKWPRITSQLD